MADMLSKLEKKLKPEKEYSHKSGQYEYQVLLDRAREYISKEKTADLQAVVDDPKAKEQLRKHIREFLQVQRISDNEHDIKDYEEMLFSGMAGFDFLDELLYDPDVETISGNWHFTQVKRSGRGKETYPKHFQSPEHARNVLWKMCLLGGKTLDASHPDIDSQISVGTRVSAIIPPLARPGVGVSYSIRKQRQQVIPPETMVANGSLTQYEMDFLMDCAKYGIPLVFAGQQDTGKTNDVAVLCSTIPADKSIFVIEDNTELEIEQIDNDGNIQNNVVYATTRESDSSNLARTLGNLFVKSLRFSVDVLVPSELRGAEAYDALQAGLAGATTITTMHAENARDAYKRLHSMCKASPAGQGIDDKTLFQDIITAYPVVVYKSQLGDHTRRVMEIVEAIDYQDGKVICNTLFEYKIKENVYHKSGFAKVTGQHLIGKIGLSARLLERLLKNGAPKSTVEKYRHFQFDIEEGEGR